jgi:carbamoyltransferase
MYILGIWDGHDAGACIVEDGVIKVAINEERLTRRKLDVGFPRNSINACLSYLKLKPNDVKVIATTTTDFSKTLTRVFPSLKERYYLFRRRKIERPRFARFQHFLKYKLTQYGNVYGLCKSVSSYFIKRELKKVGFNDFKLYFVDHHLAHAASVCFTSGMKRCLCITLDGVGDKLSGTVNILENNELKRISAISARDSIGIFFEQVTNLLGFRELEDEGKVMSMADYSYPIEDEKNKFMSFFSVNGIKIKAKYSTSKSYKLIDKVIWNHPREQVAYMAQKTLEKHVLELFKNAIEEIGIRDVCWSGGVASNIKLNRVLRLNSGLKRWFVFPHMGDGGLAVGAALYVAYTLEGIKPKRINNVYLGLDFSDEKIQEELRKFSKYVEHEKVDNPAKVAVDSLNNNYVFWFQGRMEFGPRALGNRSILAPADSEDIKDFLNLMVKKREWFQPFCPSLLEEDANKVLEDYDKIPDRFMTMGYMLRKELRKKYAPISNIDGSVRPQMVGNENQKYRELLENIKKKTGIGIVLNTSLNIHGEPIVCTPEDALSTMIRTKTKYMVLENYLVCLK